MSKSNTIDIRRHIRTFRRLLWLFVLIFLVISGLAIAFIAISQHRYDSEALLLIEESDDVSSQKTGLADMMRSFTTGGGFGRASVDNEIQLLSSRDIVRRTVDALHLNIEVSEKDGFSKKLLFDKVPFEITLSPGLDEKIEKGLTILLAPVGNRWNVVLKEGRRLGKEIQRKNDTSLPCSLTLPSGSITISPDSINPPMSGHDYVITIDNPSTTADNLYKHVTIEPRDKVSDVIQLSITDVGRERGAAILNEMMRQYNTKRLERRKENSLTELDFLNDRIEAISQELSESEAKVERFKTDKQFVDIRTEAPILLEESLGAHKDLILNSAEIAYYDQVLELLKNGSDGLLPAVAVPGAGEGASMPNQLISNYNKELLAIRELEKSALPGNSALERAQQRLQNIKESIVESFSQLLTNAKLAQSKQSGATGRMDDKLKNLPAYEREYVSLYRDNMLKNELYAYLVEKRENAMLQYYSLSTLGFVIDEASTEIKPSLKRPAIIIGGALLFAILIIFALTLIFTKRRTVVDDTMDLADIGLETNSCKTHLDKLDDAIIRIRSWLNADKNPKAVYIADFTENLQDFTQLLVDSFNKIETPAQQVALRSNDNDLILSNSTTRTISALLSEGNYAFIRIPQPDKMELIAGEINAKESRLVILLPTRTVSRKELYLMTSPFFTEHIFTLIVAE